MSYMERLEEIKQKYSNLAQLWFGGQTVVNPDIEWLIRQAEKVQELEKDVKRLSDLNYHSNLPTMKSMHEENTRLREALEFIRDHSACDVAIAEAEEALKGEGK